MRVGLLSALFALVVAETGCSLYFPDNDDDPCDFGGGGGAAEPAPAVGQRNPETGACEFFGGGGPFPCDPQCGPCPGEGGISSDEAAQPSWGFCESECTGLDEGTCTDTPGCRAVYVHPCPDGTCNEAPAFSECWSVDMTGPIQGGGCEGLDSFTCSQHDDCVAVHASSCDPSNFADPGCVPAGFLSCGDESATGEAGNCFEEVTCDAVEPDCPTDTLPGVRDGCYTGFCIPLDQCEAQPVCEILGESACVGRADCAPGYRGIDCTCDDLGCSCASFEFTDCAAL